MRGSVKSQMGYIWQQIDGIGTSKAEMRQESSETSIDGKRQVSEYVHSFEYKQEVFRTGTELGQFAREEFGIKDFEKINDEIVREYIQNKIENGVSRGTIENYISHLSKISIGLEKIAESKGSSYSAFSKDTLREIHQEVKNSLEASGHINRAYENPQAVISNLTNPKEYIAARLQLDYGLRISEATNIVEKQLNGNTLNYKGKGGYIHQKELEPQLAKTIKDNMENGKFLVNHDSFRASLREACVVEGEKYTGAHGLRYNFAQNTYTERFEQNLEKGMEFKEAHREALSYTSQKMGHHREEITNHYLG